MTYSLKRFLIALLIDVSILAIVLFLYKPGGWVPDEFAPVLFILLVAVIIGTDISRYINDAKREKLINARNA